MKSVPCVFLFPILLGLAVQAWALPDSCGREDQKLKVKTELTSAQPPGPDSGKAQIVFLETVHADGMVLSEVEARLGIDGAWVGATKGDSYFVFSVAPGTHHLCANWQADFSSEWERTSVAPLEAEAGKVYYYRIKVTHLRTKEEDEHFLELTPVNEDEGRYLMMFLPLTSTKTGK
jgi:hypothetical protein